MALSDIYIIPWGLVLAFWTMDYGVVVSEKATDGYIVYATRLCRVKTEDIIHDILETERNRLENNVTRTSRRKPHLHSQDPALLLSRGKIPHSTSKVLYMHPNYTTMVLGTVH